MVLKGRISADTEEAWEAAIGMCTKTEAAEIEWLQEDGCEGCGYDGPEGAGPERRRVLSFCQCQQMEENLYKMFLKFKISSWQGARPSLLSFDFQSLEVLRALTLQSLERDSQAYSFMYIRVYIPTEIPLSSLCVGSMCACMDTHTWVQVTD